MTSVLVIGGLDPSGRAGVLADAEMIFSLKARPRVVVTTLTAQGDKPTARAVDARMLAAQLHAVTQSGRLHAVKIRRIPHRAALGEIVKLVDALRLPTVVDPVTVSSKGLRLSTLTARDYAALSRAFVVVTPNSDEEFFMNGFQNSVVKSTAPGTDTIYLEGKRPVSLVGKVLPRSPLHRGTGCRFASALAVGLANGHTVVHAARVAKRAVRKFLSTPIIDAL